jgi:hypothetical protein
LEFTEETEIYARKDRVWSRKKDASRGYEASKIQKLYTSQKCAFANLRDPAMNEVLLESVLVCPVCGFAKRETMPTDACQFFYECSNCKKLLRPKPGDCCVFCSYGSVKCPPMQDENQICCAAK